MRGRKIGSVGATGLRSLVLFGLLLSQVRFVEAQQAPSNAGDPPVVPRSSAISGRDVNATGNVGGDQDLRLLIAHGLEMAIEGSTLQGLAMQAGLPSVDTRTAASGAARPGTAGTPGANSSGLGFTGLPGETVSGRPVTTPATGTTASTYGATGTGPTSLGNTGAEKGARVAVAPGATSTDPARAGSPSSETAASAPAMAGGSPASMLRQQSARSFQASNDLLGQANPGVGPDHNFSEAARIYAATLKSLGSQPANPIGAGGAGIAVPGTAGLPESRPVGAAASPSIGATELASIALINHGVKDALGAMKIKQMARSMGSSTSPAAQQLLSHAQRMDSESRSTIQSMGAPGAAGPGGVVQALAQQANQLIQAIQALNPDLGAPGR